MNKKAYIRRKVLTIIGSVAGTLILTGGVCYAANVGGIQETVNVWLRGEQVEATIEIGEDGNYTVTYEDGSVHSYETIGMGEDERTMTAEEIAELLNSRINILPDEDGRLWLYAGENKQDLTDLFNICEVKIEMNGNPIWIRIEKDGNGGLSWKAQSEPFVTIKDTIEEESQVSVEVENTAG